MLRCDWGEQGRHQHSDILDFDRADALLTKSLEGCTATLGEAHPETLCTMHENAILRAAQGRRELMMASSPTGQDQDDDDDNTRSNTRPTSRSNRANSSGLAAAVAAQSDRSSSARERAVGNRSSSPTRTCSETRPSTNHGRISSGVEYYVESVRLMEQAVAGRGRALGKQHPRTKASAWQLEALKAKLTAAQQQQQQQQQQ